MPLKTKLNDLIQEASHYIYVRTVPQLALLPPYKILFYAQI